MYKLLISALFFPVFAFSANPFFNLDSVCSSPQDPVTEELINLSCGEGFLSFFPSSRACKVGLKNNQRELMDKGWTQQQLNYIGYFIAKDKPSAIKTPYTKYINEELNISQAPTNKQSFLQLINLIRKNYNLNQIDNIPTTTPGCENLFSDELDTEDELTSETEEFYLTDEIDPLSAICDPSTTESQQALFGKELIEYSCIGDPESFDAQICEHLFESNQNQLLEKGWTQKQLNYFGFHASLIENSSQKVPYTIDLNETKTHPYFYSPMVFLEFINEMRESYGLEREDLYMAPGCENLFEFETEAGAECVECLMASFEYPAIDQFEEQIASSFLRVRNNQSKNNVFNKKGNNNKDSRNRQRRQENRQERRRENRQENRTPFY